MWLPSDEFKSGERGFIYDPSDFATLFQDDDLLMPVTATGQTVRKMLDKSGNGNHATLTDVVLGQGVYGKYMLDLALSTSKIVTPVMDFTVTDKVFAAMAYTKKQTAVAIGFEFGPNASQAAGTFGLWLNNSQPRDTAMIAGAAYAYEYQQTEFGYAGSVNIWSCRYDLSGATSDLRTRINKFSSNVTGALTGSYTSYPNFTAQAMTIGVRTGGVYPCKMHIYGMVVRAAENSDAQTMRFDEYMAGRAGYTIHRTAAPYADSALNVAAIGDSTVCYFSAGRSALLTLAGFTSGTTLAVSGNTIAQQKAAWIAASGKDDYDAVYVQVGINDLGPANSIAVIIAAYQDLIDKINSDVSCPVVIATMTPCRDALIAAQGEMDGEASYQKWLLLNEAIVGGGSTPITGADGIVSQHTYLMNDGYGALYYPFDLYNDHVHAGDNGRQINADYMRYKLIELGLPV